MEDEEEKDLKQEISNPIEQEKKFYSFK